MVTDDEQRALDAAYFETFGEPRGCTIAEIDSRFRAAVGLTEHMIAWQDAHPCSNQYDRKYFFPRRTSRARRYGYAPCGTFIDHQCGDPACKCCNKCFEVPKFCVSCIPACVEAWLATEPAREWCERLPAFQVPRIEARPACPSSWNPCKASLRVFAPIQTSAAEHDRDPWTWILYRGAWHVIERDKGTRRLVDEHAGALWFASINAALRAGSVAACGFGEKLYPCQRLGWVERLPSGELLEHWPAVVVVDANGAVLESDAAAAPGLCALLDAEFPADAPHVARSLIGPAEREEGETTS